VCIFISFDHQLHLVVRRLSFDAPHAQEAMRDPQSASLKKLIAVAQPKSAPQHNNSPIFFGVVY
jgi:hypothetical protein